MKKLELYECEYCKTQYKEENDALECESRHTTVDHIGECRYIASAQYPISVEIRMSDGSHRIYK